MMDKKNNIRYYDKNAQQFSESRMKNNAVAFYTKKSVKLFLEMTTPKMDSSVIDIGCGPGTHLSLLEEKGFVNLYGIDASTNMIRLADESNQKEGIFLQADAERLPFRDDCFDIVMCLGTLEHLDNADKALSEMVRISKNKVFINVPNKFSFLPFLDCFRPIAVKLGIAAINEAPPYERRFSKKEIVRLFQRYGLKNLQIQTTRFAPPIVFFKVFSGIMDKIVEILGIGIEISIIGFKR